MHSTLKERGHIQGLRAIAVLGVLLFHFGLQELPGGFTGVDIFFVISGYLISKSIYREVDAGLFSYRAFYERRARRILPAFILISTATAISGYFVLYPQPLIALAKSLIASSLFSANVYFYLTSDYFAPAANQLPLLHLWSLGVEEQFYLFFPPLVIIAKRFSRKIVIGVLAVASLFAAEIMLRTDPAAAFYLLPFRAFEILIGSWLALPEREFPTSAVGNVATAGGLSLIGGGMFFLSETTPFPGLFALIPCLGTGLVIWGCENTSGIQQKMLCSKPMLFIGAISYSLYLVHWPIAVYATQIFPNLDRLVLLAVGLPLAISLAWLSYHLVEQPFRQRREFWHGRRLVRASAFSLLALIIALSGVIAAKGFPGRVNERVNEVLAYLTVDREEMYQMGVCFMNPEQTSKNYDAGSCLPTSRPFVLLWGDSSISQFYWGLRKPLSDRGYQVGQMTASACPPILGTNPADRPNCRAFNDFAAATILSTKPDLVVMGAVWKATPEEMREVDKTVSALRVGGANVVILGPTPLFKESIPTIIANRLEAGQSILFSDYDLQSAVLRARDEAMASHFSSKGVRYVSVVSVICPKQQCLISLSGIPLYLDTLHLSKEGSELFGEPLAASLIAN